MRNLKKISLFHFFCFLFIISFSKNIQYSAETAFILGKGDYAPFWLTANQYGKYSFNNNSLYAIGSLIMPYSNEKDFDYSMGIEGSCRYDTTGKGLLNQSFLKFRYKDFILGGGRINETFGNADSSLTCGNIIWSGNALPMPKIFFRTDNFINVPFTSGFVKFKAYYCHGWFDQDRYVKDVLLHHKNLHFKIGGDKKINFSFGLEHFAQWGGESPNPRFGKLPSTLSDYILIVLIDSANASNADSGEVMNKLGNHIGSYNLSFNYKLPNHNLNIYWQSIFEDNSGRLLKNTPDGLYGISLNSNKNDKLINGILYELLYTVNQSGYPVLGDSMNYKAGDDTYFMHWIYTSDWTYNKTTIGTPFITSPLLNQNNENRIVNNSVIVQHFGLRGKFKDYNYRSLISYSRNYGVHHLPFSNVKKQLSILFEVSFPIEIYAPLNLSIKTGIDIGKMYGNNFGILISLKKTGLLFNE